MQYRLNNEVRTPRLLIRDIRQSDLPALTDFLADGGGAVVKWMMPNRVRPEQKFDEAYATELLDFYNARKAHKKKTQILHIFSAYNNEIVGVCNIWKDVQGSPRVAIYIRPAQRRKGFGSEAQFAVLKEICKRNKSIRVLFAQVEADNPASQRKMLSNGYKRLGARKFSAPGNTDPTAWITFSRRPITSRTPW